jgi:hypothetical protein
LRRAADAHHKPRDKAKVEVAVQIVERFVLARLRNQRFFSLAELNVAIGECAAAISAKVMRKIGNSRAELLETLDRPALCAPPVAPYSYADWKRARVAPTITSRSQATTTRCPPS